MIPLQSIHEENRLCTKCELRKGCIQVVPGIGPAKASIMIIGEAPGADEDEEGIPFFGMCGRILTKVMNRAGLDRKECYITNTVCCRPPKNRTPLDNEVNMCKGWLWKKIKEVDPKVIVTLGKIPTRLLLKTKKTFKLGDMINDGYNVEYIKGKIYPYYHPSFWLRQGKKHETTTVDFFTKILEYSKSS